MRRQLVIIGNSGAARECYWLARDMMEAGADFSFKGFLAFEGYMADLKKLSDKLLGTDDAYQPESDDVFAIGMGTPHLRLKAYEKWKSRGAVFLTLLHPTAVLQEDILLGEANIIARDAAISCDTVIGNANFFNGGVIVGHDAVIGDGNVFGPRSVLLGETFVGNGNLFGAQSVALPSSQIGSHNKIAPGAYVYKGCKDNCVMAGNPAMAAHE